MKTVAKRTHYFSKKQKLLAALMVVVILLVGWWAYVQFAPHPLGEKLTYLGKKDYGCWIGFCDSQPTSTYYYGTDMDVNEVIGYFRKSSVIEKPSINIEKTYFGLKTPTGETIYADFYSNDAFRKKYPDMPTSGKRYILEIPSFKYDIAKSIL